MNEDKVFDEYTEKLARDRKKKIAIAAVVGVVSVGIIGYSVSMMLSPAADIVGYIATEPAAPEEVVIDPLPPPERRTMQVSTTPPGANIIVNGVPSGLLSPANVEVVAEGRNSLSFFLDGHKSEHVLTDADQAALELTLTPYTPPARPEGWTPPLGEDGKPTEAEPVHGRVRVVTRSTSERFEGANIWHNGRLVPEPSPTLLRVQPGEEQHLLVRHPGYLDAMTFVQAIPYYRETDQRDVLLELQVDRSNAFSALSIRTFPREAKVWIDDVEVTGNIVTPVARNRHFTVRAEAPGHEPWERAFEASVGTIDLNIQLHRPVAAAGSLTVAGLPADADAYLVPLREGADGGTQIGRRGTVAPQDVESGRYLLRVAWGEYSQRKRKDLEIEVVPNEHRHIILSGSEDTIDVANITTRKPRN